MNFDLSYSGHISAKLEACQSFMQSQGWDGLLIASGCQEPIFQDDYHHPFVVNPYFKEWLPLTEVANCYLHIPASGRPSLLFHKPVDIWHKVSELPEAFWGRHFDVLEYGSDELLAKLLARVSGRVGYIGLPQALPKASSTAQWLVNDESVLNYFNFQRAYKSQYEVDSVEEANRNAAIAHTAAKQAFFAGESEYEINQAYLSALDLREADLPYGNIIALNENGATLHYTHLETKAPEDSRSFLIDAGFSVNGYAADISRSYCRDDSEAGLLFQALIQALDESQQEAIAQLQCGQPYLDAHVDMHRRVGDILQRLGVINVDGSAALAEGITSRFLPHGLGHLLGVQVHDQGGWQQDINGSTTPPPAAHPYLRLNRPLAEGMVLTVEPGIYFIEPLLAELKASTQSVLVNWDKVDLLRPYGGIRIEDNIVMTAQGATNLTRRYLP